MEQHPQVSDWATDFDHASEEWSRHAPEILDDLRSRCPVAHSDRYGGVWLPTRWADIAAVVFDREHFTSRTVVVAEGRPGPDAPPAPIGIAPPITSDRPYHAPVRRLLLPAFSPARAQQLRPATEALCARLLEDLPDSGVIDVSARYAQHIPVAVIARMLGFPERDSEMFRSFVHVVLEEVDVSPQERMENFEALIAYMTAQIAEHRQDPRDDMTSFLLSASLESGDGEEPLSDEHIVGTMILMLVAGIDTTWSAIGSALLHLASTAEDLARLAAVDLEDPLWDTAVEEFLRFYAPVTMARLVTSDVTIGGRVAHADEWVLLPFPAANRDPEVFDRADEFVIDRQDNPHSAFGMGPHKCLGAHLARMELRAAVQAFVSRYPRFCLADEAVHGPVEFSRGQVRGPRRLPLELG